MEQRIFITRPDMERLRSLLDSASPKRDSATIDQLDDELARAVVVSQDEVPHDVVTMNSRVVFEDASGRQREVTLVYPPQADAQSGRISVLAPVGAALLGLSVGQEIEWPLPGGRATTLRIISVTYQPEAAGDLLP